MSASPLPFPFVESVFHPSDFSPGGESAFAHALAIALLRRTKLTILHAGDIVEEDWARFPAVRSTLTRWGLLEPGSPRRAVFEEFSVGVTKIASRGNPVKVCEDHVARHEPDLIVLATEGRDGPSRWLRPSIAERLARRTRTMSLFVPKQGRGFVSPEDGKLSLRRILVPVDRRPDARGTIARATRAAEALGDPPVEISLLHVGRGMPRFARPEGSAWTFREIVRPGEVVSTIVEAARDSDMVAMPTDGRDGFLDAFRGSVTEQVVRGADCPVLAVPA